MTHGARRSKSLANQHLGEREPGPRVAGDGPPDCVLVADESYTPDTLAPSGEREFPGCQGPAHSGSSMCLDHLMVRTSGCGSWVNDRHADGGHG